MWSLLDLRKAGSPEAPWPLPEPTDRRAQGRQPAEEAGGLRDVGATGQSVGMCSAALLACATRTPSSTGRCPSLCAFRRPIFAARGGLLAELLDFAAAANSLRGSVGGDGDLQGINSRLQGLVVGFEGISRAVLVPISVCPAR